jgi:hypothetical protein
MSSMKLENVLPCSQQPATGPYPEHDKSELCFSFDNAF